MKTLVALFLALALIFSTLHNRANTSDNIDSAIASEQRSESDRKRDKNRKPEKVMQLLGLKPGMNIVDLSSGGGYYTDIISRIVGTSGSVISHNTPYVINRFPQSLNNPEQGWLAKLDSKQWQSNVSKSVAELDTMTFPIQLDAVLMVLFYHDIVWQKVNRTMMNQHIFNALKVGGHFLVIDHSAKTGSGLSDVNTLHRIDKQTVIDEITAAGFKLEADSDLLSNPKDTRDYPFYRDSKTKRDQTDRMVLKFVKPGS